MSCMGFIFAVTMYLRKHHFMLLFQWFSNLSKKSRSILTLPTDTVARIIHTGTYPIIRRYLFGTYLPRGVKSGHPATGTKLNTCKKFYCCCYYDQQFYIIYLQLKYPYLQLEKSFKFVWIVSLQDDQTLAVRN